MESKKGLKSYFFFIVQLLFTTILFAKEFHVSINGNNANDGSFERPLRTIQTALDLMSAGDICLIHNGIYREEIMMNKSGEAAMPIVLKAAEGEHPVISGLDVLNLKWKPTEINGVYVADYKNKNIEQIFANGKPLLEARWPNVPRDKYGDWNFFSPDAWATVDSSGNRYGTIKDSRLAK